MSKKSKTLEFSNENLKTILSEAHKKYVKLQEEQEAIYQNLLVKIGIPDKDAYVFDYLANDYLTTRQAAAHVEMELADTEAKEGVENY